MRFLSIAAMMLFLCLQVWADIFDSGIVECVQPDSTTFNGRVWGDEFLSYYETEDGYKFVQGADGWYYYALPDDSLGFVASDDTVGISPPPGESYNLLSPSVFLEQVEHQRQQFQAEVVDSALVWFKQKQAEARSQGRAVTLKIGILLAEFTDWKHFHTSDSTHPNNNYRPDGYLIEDFDRMFYSSKDDSNYNWCNPDPDPPQNPSPHPEGKPLWGSLRDYWWEVSRAATDSVGALRIVGRLINPPNDTLPEVPQWIQLDSTMQYYIEHGGHESEAIRKAKLLGWLAGDTSNTWDFPEFDRIAVIYSYATPGSGGGFGNPGRLWPSAAFKNGKGYWDVGERFPNLFKHIGTHAHEFGHTIGLPDEYEPVSNSDDFVGDFFDLMNLGGQNGPIRNGDRGNCPALISPYYRLDEYQWAEAIEIENDTTNIAIEYNYPNPKHYKITVAADSNKYFYLENRRRESFDEWTPGSPSDTNSQGGWLLVWKVEKDLNSPVQKKLELIPADGILSLSALSEISFAKYDFYPTSIHGLPAPPQNLNDETFPSTLLYNGDPAYIAIHNIHKDSLNPEVMRMNVYKTYGITTIYGQETWSSNIILREFMVIIENGGSLTIEAGSTVEVERKENPDLKTRIIIKNGGTLNINGAESNPVIFYSDGITKYDWEGIVCEAGGDINIQYSIFKHAAIALNISNISGITCEGLVLDSCNAGIRFKGSNLILSNSEFTNSPYNVNLAGSNNRVRGCRFSGGEIAVSSTDTLSEVFQCTLLDEAVLVVRDSSWLKIRENDFDNSYIVFSSTELNHGIHATVINNKMIGSLYNGTGIKLDASSLIQPHIVNNTIVKYEFGIYCRDFLATPMVKNNIIYNNLKTEDEEGNLFGYDGIGVYNDIYNLDEIEFDPPNIYADPLFVNESGGDYHLRGNSPCIDAGDPNDDYSNEPYPNGNRINMSAYGNTAEATLSFNVIARNDLTANTTWSGYVNVMEDISTNGYALTVQPGTKVLFDDGKVLAVSGDFICEGIQGGEPDTIIFRGYRPTERMGGVAVDYGDLQHDLRLHYVSFRQGETGLFLQNVSAPENPFEHLQFSGNETGLYASESTVEISASNFFDNETGLTAKGANLTLVECEFDGNSIEGLYLLDSQFRIADCAFRDNGLRGVYFEYSSDGGFYENTVTSNGYSAVNTQAKGGLVFYQSSPTLSGNRVTENKAPGMVSFASSYPLMVEPGYNLVAQNACEGSENPPEIQVYDISFPILDYGFNDIVDSVGGYLLHREGDEREIIVYVRENYWGTTDSLEIASHLYPPDSYHFSPFSRSWNSGGLGFAKGTGQGGNVLAEALQTERDPNYTAAMILYDSLAHASPLLAESKAALERLYSLKLKTGEPVANVKAYFDNLSSHPDTALATIARRLAIRCLTYDEDYQAAITEHVAWAQATPYFCDSVYSEIDILTNELFAGGGWFGKAAGSGRPGSKPQRGKQKITSAQYAKAQQVQLAQYRQETERLLNLLLEPGTRHISLLIPQEFALLQNYPNPFNPTTTIEYHLPLDSQVKIEIYNILGQRVKILVDQREKAGKYQIAWDGRNESGNRAASGLYVYRIQATSGGKTFIKARKMIVLK